MMVILVAVVSIVTKRKKPKGEDEESKSSSSGDYGKKVKGILTSVTKLKIPQEAVLYPAIFIFLLVFLAFLAEKSWPGIIAKQVENWRLFTLFITAVILYAASMKKGKDPLKYQLAPYLGWSVLILFVLWFFGPVLKDKMPRGGLFARASASRVVPASEVIPSLPGENVAVRRRTEEFWVANKPEYPHIMIGIAQAESNFNQFGEDGTTPLRGDENPQDVGVMQINEGWWLEQSVALGPEYDIYTLEGNLNMALWVLENGPGGPMQWTSYREGKVRGTIGGRTADIRLVAMPNWDDNPVVKIPLNGAIHAEGPVELRTSDGRTFDTDKGATRHLNLGTTSTLQFRSRTGEPVNVTLSQ